MFADYYVIKNLQNLRYYHGYLNGLFSNCSVNFFSEYHSNYESGDGYADIVFRNKQDEVVIIEIKTCTLSES